MSIESKYSNYKNNLQNYNVYIDEKGNEHYKINENELEEDYNLTFNYKIKCLKNKPIYDYINLEYKIEKDNINIKYKGFTSNLYFYNKPCKSLLRS